MLKFVSHLFLSVLFCSANKTKNGLDVLQYPVLVAGMCFKTIQLLFIAVISWKTICKCFLWTIASGVIYP